MSTWQHRGIFLRLDPWTASRALWYDLGTMARQEAQTQRRFGIGEWYGRSFIALSPQERKRFAEVQSCRSQVCPFQSRPDHQEPCTKKGGVCSLRCYEKAHDKSVSVPRGLDGTLRATCPYRFEQDGLIYKWVGKEILGCDDPAIVGEVPFLQSTIGGGSEEADVGRIDSVLIDRKREPLAWCALEIQAVYFSGKEMSLEFNALKQSSTSGLPFPVGHRRPDYRSSGPKRLMPQLQIKVPSLRRWGKKMAVVVDEAFFASLAEMESVKDVSNCDIAWFIVKYDEKENPVKLKAHKVQLTTLERSVEGLTAGIPVSLQVFEERIREKIKSV